LVFRYLTPPPPEAVISAADVRHPELEAQLRETPDNIDALRIYADFLQEQADPFGELIALGIASTASGKDEDVARFERHLKLHERRFLQDLGHLFAGNIAIEWRNGWVYSLELLFMTKIRPETFAEIV